MYTYIFVRGAADVIITCTCICTCTSFHRIKDTWTGKMLPCSSGSPTPSDNYCAPAYTRSGLIRHDPGATC